MFFLNQNRVSSWCWKVVVGVTYLSRTTITFEEINQMFNWLSHQSSSSAVHVWDVQRLNYICICEWMEWASMPLPAIYVSLGRAFRFSYWKRNTFTFFPSENNKILNASRRLGAARVEIWIYRYRTLNTFF